MKRVIDIHSHMLPSVDDGCRSKEEALEMLRMYEEQDVEAVICTPHFGPCGLPGADVDGMFQWINSQPSSVKLFLGNEALAGSFDPETSINTPIGPRTLAGTDVLLLEFDEWGSVHTDTNYILKTLSYYGQFTCDVILAHPERYKELRKDPEMYRQIADLGIKMQINAYDIYDTNTVDTKAITQWLLDQRLVSYIGSDAHGAIRRVPALKNGVRWIYDNCDESYADAIVHDNAAELLKRGKS